MKKDIINCNDYTDWLIKFSNKYPAWRSDMAKYEVINITSNDKKNMEKLASFFKVIENYAKENGITYYTYDKEIFYLVKINGGSFRIGMISGHDFCYYCQKDITCDKSFIDFDRIQFKSEQVCELLNDYDKDLTELESLLINLFEKKIPAKKILKTTKRVLKKIKKQ